MLSGNWRNNSLKSDETADEPLHPHHPFTANHGSGPQYCNLAAIKLGDRLKASRSNGQRRTIAESQPRHLVVLKWAGFEPNDLSLSNEGNRTDAERGQWIEFVVV